MFLFGKKRHARKKSKELEKDMEQRLATFATKEDIDKHITEHEQLIQKRQMWNQLSPRMKMKLIRRVAKKRGL